MEQKPKPDLFPLDLTGLFDRQAPRLYGLAFSYCGNKHDAEELVQDSFQALIKALRAGAKIDDMARYLVSSLRNLALSLRRKITVRQCAKDWGLQRMLTYKTDFQEISGEGSEQKIWSQMETLPPEQREVIFLHIYNELNFREIGELLGEPLTTVHTRWRTAIQRLQQALTKPE